MPILASSTYRPPLLLFNGHLQTIIPSSFRKFDGVVYDRERLELEDGDFVDLDWLRAGNDQLVIISHGLEGSSGRHYSKGMARYFHARQWDALAWNCRSCSGSINRLPRFYHHGDTADLERVILHALKKSYQKIVLVGFSMGGSMTLKYLGEKASTAPDAIKGAAVFSVPCHLGSSARELDKPEKSFYRQRFLKKLGRKIKEKSVLFPNLVSYEGYDSIRTFREFDTRYTAPLHQFADADDFYQRASSGDHLTSIQRPTLLVNAKNDPFLPPECYPVEQCKDHPCVFLEMPEQGGHVGFSLFGKKENWMEVRAFEFLSTLP